MDTKSWIEMFCCLLYYIMQCYLLKNKSAGFEPDASVRDLYVRGLDPLNGMANCPGYHGYERVWEHINHKDLGFFLFYFFFSSKKDTEPLSRPLWSWFTAFNISACRSWEMSVRGKSLWAREESSVQSVSAHCFCSWVCFCRKRQS